MTARATERFHLRATPEQAARIRAAVEIGNERSLTDYILSSALIIADQRLMDRTRLTFKGRAYDAFLRALEEPTKGSSSDASLAQRAGRIGAPKS